MAVRFVRRALYALVAISGAILLMIGAAAQFSPEGITVDTAAFIRVMAPVVIGLVCTAGGVEIALQSLDQVAITAVRRNRRAEGHRGRVEAAEWRR